jgi:hypothetical protein
MNLFERSKVYADARLERAFEIVTYSKKKCWFGVMELTDFWLSRNVYWFNTEKKPGIFWHTCNYN